MFRITSFWAALICAALALAVAEPSINCSCYCCDTTNPAHANSSSNPDTTQLYTRAMGDGLGSVAIHVIHAAAIASKLGWKFMGACGGSGKNVKMHKANEQTEFNFLFGNASEVRPHDCGGTSIDLSMYGRPWLQGAVLQDSKYISPVLTTSVLQAWAKTLPPSKVYLFNYPAYEFSRESVDFFLDEPFLSTVQKTGKCGLQNERDYNYNANEKAHFNDSYKSTNVKATSTKRNGDTSLRVVAHYRRGDVDASIGKMRESETTHPSWYFHIMGAIKKIYADASLRAFTSCSPTKVGSKQCEQMNKTDVPLWRMHGIDLHVDNEGTSDTKSIDQATVEWKNAFQSWANADIFITARSSFSQAAAYFNANCVIRNTVLNNKHFPLKRWIEIADPGAKDQDRSYMLDNSKILGLYKSHYNISHLHVTGQDHSLHFIEQLRRALRTCLPENTTSLAVDKSTEKNNTKLKIVCKLSDEFLPTGMPPAQEQITDGIVPGNCSILHLSSNSLAATVLPILESLCEKLEVIDMRGVRVEMEWVRAITRLLRPHRCPVLSVLNLQGIGIGDEGAVELFRALANNDRLEVLDVQDNDIGDTGAMHLANLLSNFTSRSRLVEIRFSGNTLTSKGSLPLATAIRHGGSLYLKKITCYRIATNYTSSGSLVGPLPTIDREEAAYYTELSKKYKIDEAWRASKTLPCRFFIDAGIQRNSAEECVTTRELIVHTVSERSSSATDFFLAFMTNEPLGILSRAIRSRSLPTGSPFEDIKRGALNVSRDKKDKHIFLENYHVKPSMILSPRSTSSNEASGMKNETQGIKESITTDRKDCAFQRIVSKLTSAPLEEAMGEKSFDKMALSHNESILLQRAVARATGIYAKAQPKTSLNSNNDASDDLLPSKSILVVSVNTAYFKCKFCLVRVGYFPFSCPDIIVLDASLSYRCNPFVHA